jgi:hypothetical protein
MTDRCVRKSIFTRESIGFWVNACLVVLTWVGVGDASAVAGCGFHRSEPHRSEVVRVDWQPLSRVGELRLPMFIEYAGGRIGYTCTRPVEPCEGPGCRANPNLQPFGFAVIEARNSASDIVSSPLLGFPAFTPRNRWPNRPQSEFAQRGHLDAPEHPPRPDCLLDGSVS